MLKLSSKLKQSKQLPRLSLPSYLAKFQTNPLKKPFCTSFLAGSNIAYIEEQYEHWQADPTSVHSSWQLYFNNISKGIECKDAYQIAPTLGLTASDLERFIFIHPEAKSAPSQTQIVNNTVETAKLQERLSRLFHRYRAKGHYIANTNPLDYGHSEKEFQTLDENSEYHNFAKEDLDKPIFLFSDITGIHNTQQYWTPREADKILNDIYCGPISYEYMHIDNKAQKEWIREKIEKLPLIQKSPADKLKLLDRILETQVLNFFLETKFSQTKRYGIEGCDSVINGMEALTDKAKELGITQITQGNAHRGRFNTLVKVFGVSYELLFAEFIGVENRDHKENQWGFTGDVKYHMQATHTKKFPDGTEIKLNIQPNPSHLETINTVALGKTRSKMDFYGDKAGDKTLCVLVHGDAAFAGQGIVYETIQMEKLEGYYVGGTIHVLINNQVGFTAEKSQGRSSHYASDLAKTNDSFVIRVNADYPEHVDYAFELACEYRQKFKRDVYLDVVGYRKFGHNENDMPTFTNPTMYKAISEKKPMFEQYCERLIKEGIVTQKEIDEKMEFYKGVMTNAYQRAKNHDYDRPECDTVKWSEYIKDPDHSEGLPITGVEVSKQKEIGVKLNQLTSDHKHHPQAVKVYETRLKNVENEKGLDWALAEQQAFGSLMKDGYNIRISGEDVERGTFSQRHAILIDQFNRKKWSPLKDYSHATNTRFSCYNSLLSEYGVLGFDYGYSIACPETQCIWEAQFGDFANCAQPIIDLCVASGERKWGLKSGLCVFLPHGFDGNGPEHSSARMERWLQMVDDDIEDPENRLQNDKIELFRINMQVLNLTSPANYFHALRRQMQLDFRKPLILMSPKKLLRHKLVLINISF